MNNCLIGILLEYEINTFKIELFIFKISITISEVDRGNTAHSVFKRGIGIAHYNSDYEACGQAFFGQKCLSTACIFPMSKQNSNSIRKRNSQN